MFSSCVLAGTAGGGPPLLVLSPRWNGVACHLLSPHGYSDCVCLLGACFAVTNIGTTSDDEMNKPEP